MQTSSSATTEEKTSVVIAHLVSLKDIIASGFRCPALVAASLERAPREQRAALMDLDRQLRAVLAACDKVHLRAGEGVLSPGGTTVVSAAPTVAMHASTSSSTTPCRRTSEDDELVMDSGPMLSPSTGGHSTTTTTPTNHHIRRGGSPQSPLSPPSSAHPYQVAAAATTCNVATMFRTALLGSADLPQAIGHERIPKPLTTGLVHGNEAPLRAMLLQHKALLDGLLHLLEGNGGEMHEALSNANMMWLQQHPGDFEAQATEAARMNAFVKAAAARGASSSHKGGGAAAVLNGSGPLPSSLLGSSSQVPALTSSSASRGATASPMETTLRQLLFLNLRLKYPAEQWAPLLHIRDDAMSSVRSFRNEFDLVVSQSNVAVSCFPSLVRLYNALDTILASLSHLNIYASPADILNIMFDRCTNALVEAQVVQHEHNDVARNRNVLEAVEQCSADLIEFMKLALQELCEVVIPTTTSS